MRKQSDTRQMGMIDGVFSTSGRKPRFHCAAADVAVGQIGVAGDGLGSPESPAEGAAAAAEAAHERADTLEHLGAVVVLIGNMDLPSVADVDGLRKVELSEFRPLAPMSPVVHSYLYGSTNNPDRRILLMWKPAMGSVGVVVRSNLTACW